MQLSNNIRSFRKEHSLTQEQLGEALGVTASAVYNWEAGLSTPDINLILALAELFDTSFIADSLGNFCVSASVNMALPLIVTTTLGIFSASGCSTSHTAFRPETIAAVGESEAAAAPKGAAAAVSFC